jgi:hypothetical protein
VVSIKSAPRHITLHFCFCISWALQVTRCNPMHPGRKTSTHYFSCSSGRTAVSIESASRHVMPNLCFCIRWDMWVGSAFRHVWGVKRQHTIFQARVVPVQITQKARRDQLRQTCVSHLVGSMGHMVHSGVSMVRNIDTIFFMLGWPSAVSIKTMSSHVTSNLWFYIR